MVAGPQQIFGFVRRTGKRGNMQLIAATSLRCASHYSYITATFFSVVFELPKRCLHMSSRCLHTSSPLSASQSPSSARWHNALSTNTARALKQRTHFRCLCIYWTLSTCVLPLPSHILAPLSLSIGVSRLALSLTFSACLFPERCLHTSWTLSVCSLLMSEHIPSALTQLAHWRNSLTQLTDELTQLTYVIDLLQERWQR